VFVEYALKFIQSTDSADNNYNIRGVSSAMWVGVMWRVSEMSQNFLLSVQWSLCVNVVVYLVINYR